MDLTKKSLFLLDMDGTVYHENDLIDGAREFLSHLKNNGMEYLFMTNNSSKSAEDYVNKLTKMGIMADYNDIFTSGQAAGIYLKSLKKSPCVYVMGTLSLKKELADMNIDVRENVSGDIEYFLAGYDTELTYQKLKDACDLLYEGIPFYATNPDLVCPAKKGRYLPDCASVCSMLTNATGREPFYIGKPRREMALVAVESRHKKNGDAVIVGDRLYTDIKCGINAGITSVLVLSGESAAADTEKYNIYPDLIVDNLGRLIEMTQKL